MMRAVWMGVWVMRLGRSAIIDLTRSMTRREFQIEQLEHQQLHLGDCGRRVAGCVSFGGSIGM